jgi:hypothetical protein
MIDIITAMIAKAPLMKAKQAPFQRTFSRKEKTN